MKSCSDQCPDQHQHLAVQGLNRFIGGGLFEVKKKLEVPFVDSFHGFWGCRLLPIESLCLEQGK